MEKIKLKAGRPGIPLDKASRVFLARKLADPKTNVATLSKRIGITARQLRYPLLERGTCSPESYKKIMGFITREQKRSERRK